MNDTIKKYHYPDVTKTNGVQDEPLFWDYVGKPVWDVSKECPIYVIEYSSLLSFNVRKDTEANYAHIIDAHKCGNYSRGWIFFKERNDANRFIRKVKNFIEQNRFTTSAL